SLRITATLDLQLVRRHRKGDVDRKEDFHVYRFLRLSESGRQRSNRAEQRGFPVMAETCHIEESRRARPRDNAPRSKTKPRPVTFSAPAGSGPTGYRLARHGQAGFRECF